MYRENVSILFAYPSNIHTAICTTNATDSLNNVIRYAIKNRNFFFKMIRLEGHSYCDKTSIRNMDNVHLKLKKCDESIYCRI